MIAGLERIRAVMWAAHLPAESATLHIDLTAFSHRNRCPYQNAPLASGGCTATVCVVQ